MQPGFWEHDAMLDADFIVVGGGIIGLQTALELREHAVARAISTSLPKRLPKWR